MTPSGSKVIDECEIRALMNDRAKAVRAQDVNGAMFNYAADVQLFDVVNPLQYTGSDAARRRAEEWFSSFQAPLGYEMRDLRIAAGHDVAFCYSLNQVKGTKIDGGQLEMWWRATVCFRKIDGRWKITHEHSSVPFDVESGRASLGLNP